MGDAQSPDRATYVSYRLWSEDDFAYREYSGLIDAPEAAEAMHDPPLLIVTGIRQP